MKHVPMPNETQREIRGSAGGKEDTPRVGVPWTTVAEESAGNRERYDNYLRAVRKAGGAPVELSLFLTPEELRQQLTGVGAFLLPGNPADVDPARYGATRHPKCAESDPQRERTDFAVLDHAFRTKKPVLGICYGTQSLNVYLGGTLIQDIASQTGSQIRHGKKGLPPGSDDPRHATRLEPGSTLSELAGRPDVEINSSHRQAVLTAGRGLRVAARSPDGVVEAVEWTDRAHWVLGVQWHPERMGSDALALALFRQLVAAALPVSRLAFGGNLL
jgi:putative glutamine amidotransferase